MAEEKNFHMPVEEFRRNGHALIDWIADYYQRVESFPVLSEVKPGEVRVQTPGGEEQAFYVSGGALEIQPHLVTVLADTALRAKDLDEAAAQQALQRAQEAARNQLDKISAAQAQDSNQDNGRLPQCIGWHPLHR